MFDILPLIWEKIHGKDYVRNEWVLEGLCPVYCVEYMEYCVVLCTEKKIICFKEQNWQER